ESALPQESRVGATVEGDAAAEAEIAEPGLDAQVAGDVDQHLLEDRLRAGRDVGVARPLRRGEIDRLLGIPRRSEQLDEARAEGTPGALLKVEVRERQPERAILRANEGAPDLVQETRLSVGGEPHDLVLAFVDRKPEVGGEGRIEEAERMRKAHLAQELQAGRTAGRPGPRPTVRVAHSPTPS